VQRYPDSQDDYADGEPDGRVGDPEQQHVSSSVTFSLPGGPPPVFGAAADLGPAGAVHPETEKATQGWRPVRSFLHPGAGDERPAET
jgi:hypothetical protein